VFIFLYVRTDIPPQLDRLVETLVSKRVCLLAFGLRFSTGAIKTVGLSVVCSKGRVDDGFITQKFFAALH